MKDQYYHTQESVQEYIHLAEDVNGAELIEELKKHLPSSSKVLEIGTGPGSDWEILSKDYEVTGSDYSQEFLKYLKLTFLEGKFILLNAVTLDVEETFNGIYSNKVLQHLNDEELKSSIIRQATILEPGGIICHSFWKGKGDEIFKGMLVNYQDEATLSNLFSEHFEMLLIQTYKEFEDGDSILLIAKKK